MKKSREKCSQRKTPNPLTFSLKFDKVQSPRLLKTQTISPLEHRVVIARHQQPLPFKLANQGMIKSLNISRHHIEDQKQMNLQFSKKLKVQHKGSGNAHIRTLSHPFSQEEGQGELLSDFSNSLENLSSEIIEIPFANTKITQKGQIGALRQPKNRIVVQFDRKEVTPLKRSLGKTRNGSEDLRGHVKKISYSKENLKSSMRKNVSKLQTNFLPKPKKHQNSNPKLSLSDFILKAIKITRSGSIIYMAIHRKTSSIYALKSIRKSKAKQKQSQLLLQLKLGLFANHPNLLKIYGFFEQGDNIYLIKEYLQEGGLVDQRRGLLEPVISQYLNQLLFGAIRLSNLMGLESWHLTPLQIAKTHGIIKITNVHLTEQNNIEIFSQQFKKTIEYFFESDRRSTFQGLTAQTLASSRYPSTQKQLGEFMALLQKILMINQSTLHLLWQHPFVKQSRFKAIMQN